jgi:hypothetical protein
MMKLFVDLWSDPLIVEKTPSWVQREQQALTYLIERHPQLRERVGYVDQRLIDGYVEGAGEWREGDLLVHFAGCWYAFRSCVRGLILGWIRNVWNGLTDIGGGESCYLQRCEGKIFICWKRGVLDTGRMYGNHELYSSTPME